MHAPGLYCVDRLHLCGNVGKAMHSHHGHKNEHRCQDRTECIARNYVPIANGGHRHYSKPDCLHLLPNNLGPPPTRPFLNKLLWGWGQIWLRGTPQATTNDKRGSVCCRAATLPSCAYFET
eukprot:3709515-Amphidinium_carterae.1